MERDTIIEAYHEKFGEDCDLLLADGLDDALIGFVEQFGRPPVACYDIGKCIDVFVKQGMTGEEATEYFYYNTIGAYVGEETPAFITLLPTCL